MFHVIALGIFAVFFAFIARDKQFSFGLKISFILIFIFLALRFDYGNDYQSYLEIFKDVNIRYAEANLFDGSIYGEIGWLILCFLFRPFGFFAMVAVLALFNCIVYYRFIRTFVAPKFYWLAVFIYVFDPGFMLIHLSAMRQSLAIGIFLVSIRFIMERKLIYYILTIVLASFFHSSALILLPVYFLHLWKPRFSWKGIAIVLLIYIAFFIFKDSISPFLTQFVTIYFDKYSRHFDIDGVVLGSGLGVLFSTIMLTFVLNYSKYHPKKYSTLINLVIVSFLFIPLSLMFEMFSRPAMYLLPCLIVIYPTTFSYVKNGMVRNGTVILLMCYILLQFFIFFNSEIYRVKYEIYNTIISFL